MKERFFRSYNGSTQNADEGIVTLARFPYRESQFATATAK
jgi:hypothetical protein